MNNVNRNICYKVKHIDKNYLGKKYDKLWFKVVPIMDELKNQIEGVVYYNIISKFKK